MKQGCQRRLRVSVIIPTYNRAAFVKSAIESALNQSRLPDEIVVVDDGSTDNTQQVLSQFGPPVVVVQQPNLGVSAARNLGLAVARGDIVVFLDSDDLLLPNCIEQNSKTLEQRPDVDVVYSDCCLIDSAANRVGLSSQAEPGKRPTGMILGQLGHRWYMINPTSTAVRSSALRNVLFDTRLICGEDFDFFRQLAVRSRFFYLNEILSCYRYHDSRATATHDRETLDGAIEVQRRIMEMPEFNLFARGDRARLFCVHGIKHAERGWCHLARRFFFRSVCTSPGYLPGHVLLFIGLLGLRPLRFAIHMRRRLFRNGVDTKAGIQPIAEGSPNRAGEVPPAAASIPVALATEYAGHG